jgi:hypothetical protein
MGGKFKGSSLHNRRSDLRHLDGSAAAILLSDFPPGRTLARGENEMNSAERHARMRALAYVLPKTYAACSLYRLVPT